MSESIRFGEFEIDPDTIPSPPQVTTGVEMVFEVETATRKEVVKEETGRTVYVEVSLRPVEQPEALLYNTWFVTEKYAGTTVKSWKNFLLAVGLDPRTAKAQDIVRLRFKGIAGKNRRDPSDDRPVLVKVVGAAN